MIQRIKATFDRLKSQQRTGLVTFFVANDPNEDDFNQLLASLPSSGVDIIEIGMPFSDPVADGIAIQAAAQRAIATGVSLSGILTSVATFRKVDNSTPIVLMGYLNPVLSFGESAFFQRCAEVGVDGLILVDLPPEEEAEIRQMACRTGIDLIRLITPTTSAERIAEITSDCSGFIYFVSVSGITGTKTVDNIDLLGARIAQVRAYSDLPIAVGFGIKDDTSAQQTAQFADAIVIGSMLVDFNNQLYRSGIKGNSKVESVGKRILQFRKVLDQE